MLGLALVALLGLAAAIAPVAALAAGGSIAGTVTDAGTLEPIEGIEVCALPLEGEEEWTCAETDAAGEYEIAELPAGEYGVEFWGRSLGYATEYYDNKAKWWQLDPVVVGTEPVTGIDAELSPAPGLEGTVTRSSDGEPVEEVEVCAWPADPEEEETFGECGYTGADGSYFIALEPGNYKVEFWPGSSGQNLALQFYDGRDRWDEADTVAVEAGERTGGIDAELDPGATISGTVSSAASGAGLEEIRVCSIDAPSGLLWICTWSDESGHYDLPFHAQGQYKVVFSLDLSEWFGEEFWWEEDDGYPTQYWNNQATLAAANVISLATGQSVAGIDARLGVPGPSPPSPSPAPMLRAVPPIKPLSAKKHCRRGFKRKKIKGKVRCVRRHRHHRHHRRFAGARPNGEQAPFPRDRLQQRAPFRVSR